ncbi:MAG: hypothetical protein OSA99_20155, partial [Acidimicrobiales bacterium]|nr:hypothetical protein [Acidimicrobiales bacterium]
PAATEPAAPADADPTEAQPVAVPSPAPRSPTPTTVPATPTTAPPGGPVPPDAGDEDEAEDEAGEPPPVERTAPVVELPLEIGPIGNSLVLDHALLDPLEPVICPILGLPAPITGCTTDEPSDLVRVPDAGSGTLRE